MTDLQKNSGFVPPEDDFKDTDFIAGTLTAIPYQETMPDGNWRKYKPTGEYQKFRWFDSMACVSFSFNQAVAEQINRFIVLDIIDKSKIADWIDNNGNFNASDRATAKLSNTSTSGNSQPRVADAVRHYGLIPEKYWPNPTQNEEMTWDQYYKKIPDDVLKWGLKFLDLFEIQYERIPDSKPETLKKHLKQASLWIASACCPGWNSSSVIQSCDQSPCHATIIDCFDNLKWWGDFDHYEPFEKKLVWDYPIYYPYKVIVMPKDNILKKNDEETMQLYKAKGSPDCYFLGADNLYHKILDEGFVKIMWGGFDRVPITEFVLPDDSKIGGMIGTLKASSGNLLALIAVIFSKIKGLKKVN